MVTPSVLEGKKLVSSVEQGKSVYYVGTLRPAGYVWKRPGKFRLTRKDSRGRAVTSCYVLGNESQLAGLRDSLLRVVGKEYWIQGVRYPVVVPEQIIQKGK